MKWMTKETKTKKIEEAHKFLKNEEFDVNDLGDEFFDELHKLPTLMFSASHTPVATTGIIDNLKRGVADGAKLPTST